ncbi:MAG: hypothetical protein IT223_10595 [Crocinitomicaceae bacterium]|nr:hypothetical protein [Crocinitomicaceae bacterium]
MKIVTASGLLERRTLPAANLTGDINNRVVICKDIEQSCYYEGYKRGDEDHLIQGIVNDFKLPRFPDRLIEKNNPPIGTILSEGY